MTEKNKKLFNKGRSYKKTDALINRILDIVRNNNPPKAVIARAVKIKSDTITKWINTDAVFRERFQEAVNYYFDSLKPTAVRSLKKLVEGFDVEDVKTVYIDSGASDPMIKERVVTKRHIEPSLEAVKFVLTNSDAKKYYR